MAYDEELAARVFLCPAPIFAVLDGQAGPEFDDVSPLFAEKTVRAAATEPRGLPATFDRPPRRGR